jgi:16S rRNA processing protein RimM
VISNSDVDANGSREHVRFLVVGQILGPSGLSGDLRVEPLTDFPDRFEQLAQIHVGEKLRPYPIESVRVDGRSVVLKLRGVDDANAALALRDTDLSIPIDQAIELPPDSYYWHQIIGLAVWTDDGRLLGHVSEVLRTGSNDVYVVWDDRRELLLPAIEDVILNVDVSQKRLLIHLLPGIE